MRISVCPGITDTRDTGDQIHLEFFQSGAVIEEADVMVGDIYTTVVPDGLTIVHADGEEMARFKGPGSREAGGGCTSE
ncbi:hypothetical protein CLV92_1154 [Kineococcus xinjiangensis]|uniref:Uncharacterized protein n=1 Tax=Kineococcus xinjiangensis TaxID=512762 RepID=A0A2S6IDF9_9ACTN|nr:hypothetical protein CLV92_1154 [Kineococcus xinjiangensis]